MHLPRWFWCCTVASAFIGIAAGITYRIADPEQLELDAAARRSAPGQFVRLAEGYTHYDLAGPPDGRVAVLAAGGSVPYYIWDPIFTALVARGFHVLRYDYYGRGFSDRPHVSYTQDLYVRQLAELLDTLGIHAQIDLLALSFGGSVATSFAEQYPGRVHSLAYIDPAFRSPRPVPRLARFAPAWHFQMAVSMERALANEQLGDFLHPERFPDWPARYEVQLQFRGFRRARLSHILSFAEEDQTEKLRRVGQHPRPVLLIWGRQDRVVPFELSAQVMALMPRAKLVAVDSAGHLPHWEQPEVVVPAVIDFLQRGETMEESSGARSFSSTGGEDTVACQHITQ